MEHLSAILLVQAIFLAAVITPGPDFIAVSATALNNGRWPGLAAVAGTTLGMSVWVIAAMAGVPFVFEHMVGVAATVRIAGGLYLIFLALQLIRRSFRQGDRETGGALTSSGSLRAFRRGLLVNLGNPKALVLFTSLAALLVKPDTPLWALAVSGGGILALTFAWYAVVVVALTHPGIHRRYRAVRRWVDRLAGAALAAFGVRLITAE